MAFVPAAAAEGSVAGLVAVGLLGLLAWAVLRGLLSGYDHSLGFVLDKLAGVLRVNVRFVHLDFGGPIRALDNSIRHKLSEGASGAEALAGRLFHAAALVQEWAWHEVSGLAHETLGLAQWLAHVHVPKLTKAALLAVFPPALLAALIAEAVRKYGVRVVNHTKGIVKAAAAAAVPTVTIPYLGQWAWIHRHWRALTALVASAGALVGALHLPHVTVFPRLRALERWEGYTRKRLRRLERLLAASGLALAMANVLGLPNWRCLTRGNIGRTARALCGIPAHALDDLLGLIVDFLVIEDICQVVTLLTDAFGLVEGPLASFAGGVGAALCHGDYGAAPTVTVRGFVTPPMQGRSVPVEA